MPEITHLLLRREELTRPALRNTKNCFQVGSTAVQPSCLQHVFLQALLGPERTLRSGTFSMINRGGREAGATSKNIRTVIEHARSKLASRSAVIEARPLKGYVPV